MLVNQVSNCHQKTITLLHATVINKYNIIICIIICHFEYHYLLVRFILDTIACFYDIVFNTIAKLFSSYRCIYKCIIIIIISFFSIRNN